MSQFQVLKGLCREEKEIEIWKSVQTLSEGRNLHAYLEQNPDLAVQGECAAQKSLSEAEVEMDIRSWEQRNADIALYETNRELESQRLELYQANQGADQTQRETIHFFFWRIGNEKQNLSTKSLSGLLRNWRITKNLLRRNR